MAICGYCNREMTVADSCSAKTLHLAGMPLVLPPFGAETRMRAPEEFTGRCHDCGVQMGGFHHPGCDMAECPRCREQLLGCGCRFDEDVEEQPVDSGRWN